VPAPALTALAKTIPRPSKARRSIRPLPATNSGSCGVRLRCLSAMISSLEAVDAGLNIFKTAVKQSSGYAFRVLFPTARSATAGIGARRRIVASAGRWALVASPFSGGPSATGGRGSSRAPRCGTSQLWLMPLGRAPSGSATCTGGPGVRRDAGGGRRRYPSARFRLAMDAPGRRMSVRRPSRPDSDIQTSFRIRQIQTSFPPAGKTSRRPAKSCYPTNRSLTSAIHGSGWLTGPRRTRAIINGIASRRGYCACRAMCTIRAGGCDDTPQVMISRTSYFELSTHDCDSKPFIQGPQSFRDI
jgi:hypothetical protein